MKNWENKSETDVITIQDEVVIIEQRMDVDLNKRHQDSYPWHAVVAGMRIVCHAATRADVIEQVKAKIKRKKEYKKLQQYFAQKKARALLAKKK